MVEQHDFDKFPELTNRQLQEMPFQSPHQQIIEGFEADVVRVHDGDTVTLRVPFRDFDFPLRLLGIDAPEMNAGGEEARDWVRGRIDGERVTVLIDKDNRVDKWGRLLGHIFHRGMNVAEEEINLGLAVPFDRRLEGELPNLDKLFSLKQWL